MAPVRAAARALVAALLLCAAATAQPSPKPIRASLRASWPSTPRHLEAAEFFADESAEHFWSFADTYAAGADPAAEAAANLSVAKRALLSLYLGARHYSPAVEYHRQVEAADRAELAADPAARAWAVVGGDAVAAAAGDVAAAAAAARAGAGTTTERDHVYPGADPSAPLAVLYAEIGTPEFRAFHEELKRLAGEKKVRYVLRHKYDAPEERAVLQGYGVELSLKSVEYKAIDEPSGAKTTPEAADIAALEQRLRQEQEQPQQGGAAVDLEFSDDFDKLEQAQLANLGFQAATVAMQAQDPLAAMQHIAQDFPSLAVSLSKVATNVTVARALAQNAELVGSGYTSVVINGREVDAAQADIFQVLELVREEAAKVETLTALGVPTDEASALFASSSPESGAAAAAVRVALDSPNIVYANDLRHDPHYRRFFKSVNDFMRPVYPGQLRYVARNLFTIVLVVDPGDSASLELCGTFAYFLDQMLPMRVGVLVSMPASAAQPECDAGGSCHPSAAAAAAQAFHYVAENGDRRRALGFLGTLGRKMGELGLTSATIPVVADALAEIAGSFGRSWDLQDVFADSAHATWAAESSAYAAIAGVDSPPLAFVNGQLFPHRDPNSVILGANNELSAHIRELILAGAVTDATEDIYAVMLEGAPQRYSKIAAVSEDRPLRFVALHEPRPSRVLDAAHWFVHEQSDVAACMFTHMVCADLDAEAGRRLARAALEFISSGSRMFSRVALLSASTAPHASPAYARVNATSTPSQALAALAAEDAAAAEGSAHVALTALEQEQREFCSAAFGSAYGVVVNGRAVRVDPARDAVMAFDIESVEIAEEARLGAAEALVDRVWVPGTLDAIPEKRATLLAKIVSVLGADEASGVARRTGPSNLQGTIRVNSECAVVVRALVNPLSKQAQRVLPILRALADAGAVCLEVTPNPVHRYEGLPLKTFYRAVVGGAGAPEAAFVGSIPAGRLLTLGMDVPHSWIVMAHEAEHDLDNIRLAEDAIDAAAGVQAVYSLEHLLVEGNCYEEVKQVPPRGLELELVPGSAAVASADTLVMSNFGYFQLKAAPGPWVLSIRAGRSRELFSVSGTAEDGVRVAVNSFLPNVVRLDVRRVAGKENVPLLPSDAELEKERVGGAASDGSQSLWGKLSAMIKQKAPASSASATNVSDDDKVHVFSVASGHLYERFMKIMMLSVVKHSSAPVKFWLIKNYLSPRLIDSLPALARAHGFEYEYVTYKWPAWLHPQVEKQRLIWGYKILFLDVLFPVSLKKVIYVDADQVVRGDLKELMDLPLNRAAVGMTPFCSGENMREETRGFRFWDSGFWKDHLRGRPYHISALFVVDLARFRRIAAGDQYRAHYDGLAKDPNSLANLDQDLPNYLQHVVKLHSLPQHWLWCESWCNDDSKGRAKTIDLCNNPLTKMPKLELAQKVIGQEWRDYDALVRAADQQA